MIPPCYSTTSSHKQPVASPYYITMTSPRNAPSPYSHLQHHNTPTIAPMKRSTSDNCLTVYEKIYPQHQKDESNYENLKPNAQVEVHHKNTPNTAPMKRSTSVNCLIVYEKMYPQHQKVESNYENLKPNTQVEVHHK